jgi:hypothetical protein
VFTPSRPSIVRPPIFDESTLQQTTRMPQRVEGLVPQIYVCPCVNDRAACGVGSAKQGDSRGAIRLKAYAWLPLPAANSIATLQAVAKEFCFGGFAWRYLQSAIVSSCILQKLAYPRCCDRELEATNAAAIARTWPIDGQSEAVATFLLATPIVLSEWLDLDSLERRLLSV